MVREEGTPSPTEYPFLFAQQACEQLARDVQRVTDVLQEAAGNPLHCRPDVAETLNWLLTAQNAFRVAMTPLSGFVRLDELRASLDPLTVDPQDVTGEVAKSQLDLDFGRANVIRQCANDIDYVCSVILPSMHRENHPVIEAELESVGNLLCNGPLVECAMRQVAGALETSPVTN